MSKFINSLYRKCSYLIGKIKSSTIDSAIGKKGDHCFIHPESVLVPQNIFMDDYSILQNGINMISAKGQLVIGRFSVVSSGCLIITDGHIPVKGVSFYDNIVNHIADNHGDIIIEEDCWICAGAVLIGPLKIGRGSIIAAGSVVTKDVPPYAVVAGNPARIIAVKFSLSDIISHESCLYKEEDRMTESELKSLFDNQYQLIRVKVK